MIRADRSAGRQAGQTELRHYAVKLRLTGTDAAPVLEGHAAVFDQLSEDLGGFREKIAPGAFAETIKRDSVVALWNHDSNLVLGRTSAGTLDLSEDAIGLRFRNRPPDTAWFRDRALSIERKDVDGCSFGFVTERDRWSTGPGGARVRTLEKVTLLEVSPGCTFPAYPQTDVALRSMQAWLTRRGSPGLDPRRLRLRLQEHYLGSRACGQQDLKWRRLRLHELKPGSGACGELDLRRRRLHLHELALQRS